VEQGGMELAVLPAKALSFGSATQLRKRWTFLGQACSKCLPAAMTPPICHGTLEKNGHLCAG